MAGYGRYEHMELILDDRMSETGRHPPTPTKWKVNGKQSFNKNNDIASNLEVAYISRQWHEAI